MPSDKPENPYLLVGGSDAKNWSNITLRDLFAAAALTGVLSNDCAPDYTRGQCNAAAVERAFVVADAMLAAREKRDAE